MLGSLPRLGGFLVSVCVSLSGCEEEDTGNGVGEPCVKTADCEEGLFCDVHEGLEGTCEWPHDHTG